MDAEPVNVKVTIEMDDGDGGGAMHMDRSSGLSMVTGIGLSVALCVEAIVGTGLQSYEVLANALEDLEIEDPFEVDPWPLLKAAREYLDAASKWRENRIDDAVALRDQQQE
jgi:hypothetical protein